MNQKNGCVPMGYSRQTTDKGFRTKVLSPLSYFTEKRKYGIIKIQEKARRNANVYGKKREA
ncbi:MAG: hypothetical protein IKK74_09935, partial [Clostridia bacterium]|nr:hypothetical protein [Clostridia bacterium]